MNIYASLLRTGVPAVAGWLVAVVLRHGLDLDTTGSNASSAAPTSSTAS
ncbi:hypothetical protein [Streptomyces pseudoechinosporeus]